VTYWIGKKMPNKNLGKRLKHRLTICFVKFRVWWGGGNRRHEGKNLKETSPMDGPRADEKMGGGGG